MAKKLSPQRVTKVDTKHITTSLRKLENDIKANPKLKELFRKKPELVAAKYGLTEDVQNQLMKGIAAACGGSGTCEVTCEVSCLLTCALTNSSVDIEEMVTRISKEVIH